mmetsp:Transcript_26696/g.83184  ORF Transcript_26696/g.83184 Transcript_26696/m.83184 type:complete len:323 (-) Transcript_26696:619-1587(-)
MDTGVISHLFWEHLLVATLVLHRILVLLLVHVLVLLVHLVPPAPPPPSVLREELKDAQRHHQAVAVIRLHVVVRVVVRADGVPLAVAEDLEADITEVYGIGGLLPLDVRRRPARPRLGRRLHRRHRGGGRPRGRRVVRLRILTGIVVFASLLVRRGRHRERQSVGLKPPLGAPREDVLDPDLRGQARDALIAGLAEQTHGHGAPVGGRVQPAPLWRPGPLAQGERERHAGEAHRLLAVLAREIRRRSPTPTREGLRLQGRGRPGRRGRGLHERGELDRAEHLDVEQRLRLPHHAAELLRLPRLEGANEDAADLQQPVEVFRA